MSHHWSNLFHPALLSLVVAVAAIPVFPGHATLVPASSLETPFRFLGPDVYAEGMAIRGDTVVIGGTFRGADDFSGGPILKWDGTRWSEGYPGLNSWVMGLKWIGDRLYAVGFFDHATGCDSCLQAAYWEKGAWHPMGRGFGDNNFPTGIGSLGDTVFATTYEGPFRWTGTAWERFGPAIKGNAVKLEGYGGKLWMAGSFDPAPGVSNLMRWDGNAWTSPAGADVERVHDILWHDGALFMLEQLSDPIGLFRISRYDGNVWTEVSGDAFGFYAGRFASNGKDLYLASERFNEGFALFRWNGEEFKLLDWQEGRGGETNLLAFTASGKLIQSANMNQLGKQRMDYLSQWDGQTWSPLTSTKPPYGPSSYPTAMGSDGKRLYLGGNPLDMVGPYTVSHAAAWDGGNVWDTLGGGLKRPVDNRLVDVNAWGAGSDGMYAGGDFAGAGDGPALNVARWDGHAWHGLGDGFGGPVFALARAGEGMLIAGRNDSAFKLGANALPVGHSVGRWESGVWSSLGTGLFGTVKTVAEYQGSVFAAGSFALSKGGALCAFASWDGKAWTAFHNVPGDSLLFDSVYALQVFKGRMYALGSEAGREYPWDEALMAWDGKTWEVVERISGPRNLFTDGERLCLNGGVFPDLANKYALAGCFDGQDWLLLDVGDADLDVRSTGLFNGTVYFGGWLRSVRGVPAAWLASWNLKPGSPVRPEREIRTRRKGADRKYIIMGKASVGGTLYRMDGRR